LPPHLERREVVIDLTEAVMLCPCCVKPCVCIGAQTAEQLDLEPPSFFVLRTVKKTYASSTALGSQSRPPSCC
jgi:transposase